MATAGGAESGAAAAAAAAAATSWEEEREAKVKALLAQMTQQEKIMQIGQVDKTFLKDLNDIATLGFGSLISGGSGQPFENSPVGFANMVDEYQSYALKSRLKIPVLYAGDAVHGMSLCKGTTLFPHNIGLGAANDPALVEAIARATAVETACTGVAWAFAPCVAVAGDCRWGRTYESFSEDTAIVTAAGVAHVKGLQGDILSACGKRVPGTVAACVKHYVGDGGTTYGTGLMGAKLLDRGDVQMGEEEFRARHLQPYVEAVKAGAMTIMVSFSSWNGEQMHAHRHLIEDVLRGKLGFKGLIVSDWAGHEQLRGASDDKEKLALCINAGVDLIMIPERYRDYLAAMQAALREGLLSEARLEEACARMLRIKFDLGLFDSPTVDRGLLTQIRCPEHLALARRAVQQSCVLLKNRGPVLPLRHGLRSLFVCGKGAADLGLQCGGWSCSWQGSSGAITTGTTILEALATALADTQITYAEDARWVKPDRHDAVLVVVAEDPPYAEWFGDRHELSLSKADQRIVDRVVQKGVPVVAVVLSGRPLIEQRNWADVDALLMAFLPGTEGGLGIVDLLLGAARPTGKMPLGLPAGLRVDEAARELFAMGRGLTYPEGEGAEGGGGSTIPPPQPFLRREYT